MFDSTIAIIALIVSILSLGLSIYFWKRQFRPIVTVAVKTAAAGEISIAFDLQIKNSGSIPAKDIKLTVAQADLENALGSADDQGNRDRWLAAFNEENLILSLQNGESVTCSFGMSQLHDQGFWKYKSNLPITIEYLGWFGTHYKETQTIKIMNSDSFTDFHWGGKRS
jgi:hypothetical protein